MGLSALPAGFDARKYAGKLVGTQHDGRNTEIRNIEEREGIIDITGKLPNSSFTYRIMFFSLKIFLTIRFGSNIVFYS